MGTLSRLARLLELLAGPREHVAEPEALEVAAGGRR